MEALEDMIEEFSNVFNLRITADDIFYYGVFCKPVTYANYSHWDEAPEDVEVPEILTSDIPKASEKVNYVKLIMDEVMKGENEKPDWMIHVEMEEICNNYEQAPSTFLYITPKEDKYDILSQAIVNFLYSPNLLITMTKD